MKKFRITKYNPSFRNEKGEYTHDEWTSFWDVGKKFYNGVLEKEVYYEVESKYLQAIKYILDDNNISSMRIVQLEKYNNKNLDLSLSNDEESFKMGLKIGSLIGHDYIEILCKMILRELLWAKLETIDGVLTIEFGYDYYMYVHCEKIEEYTKGKILLLGLFIEEFNE